MTADGSWTAQFEHTLLITNDGYRVLTKTGSGGGAALNPGTVAEGAPAYAAALPISNSAACPASGMGPRLVGVALRHGPRVASEALSGRMGATRPVCVAGPKVTGMKALGFDALLGGGKGEEKAGAAKAKGKGFGKK